MQRPRRQWPVGRSTGLPDGSARRVRGRPNRLGDFGAAVKELHAVAGRIKRYAGRDPELHAIADALLAEEAQWSAPMMETSRKMVYAAANYSLRSRREDGRATR